MDLNPFFLIHGSSRGGGSFLILLLSLMCLLGNGDGYDPLDPNGNISIKWDIIEENDDNQVVTVSIFNYQLYRHIDHPGWKLSWQWPGDGVIWDMWGAEATEQGNCSAFKTGQRPHCCEKKPVIIDLLPGTRFNKQFLNCCKGGVLSSMTQDPEKYLAAFQMSIGRVSSKSKSSSAAAAAVIPGNFTLGVPGYTCGEAFEVPPSKFVEDHGRRTTQAVVLPVCIVYLCGVLGRVQGRRAAPGCSAAALRATTGDCAVHETHVPDKGPLACQAELHTALEGEDHDHKLQFRQELQPVEPRGSSPKSGESYTDDTGMFYGIQYYNDMLLQGGGGRECADRAVAEQRSRNLHFQGRMGFSQKDFV
nr:cobra-like protein 6 [Ipomoea batatas]